MFDSFDDDKDGRIDANELAGALGYYEYASLRSPISPISPTHWRPA